MAEYVDEKVQDGNVLLRVVRKYKNELAEAGNFIRQKTVEQNEQLKRARACIRKIKTAAKDAFYGNSEMLKEFHIGGKSVTTVKGMLTELAYFKEKVSRRLEDLTNSGIKDDDITEIDDCMSSLTSVDTDQENGVLQQQMSAERRLRLLTKLCFVYARKRRYASQVM
ncbi:MAG: hypothetical protein L6422_09560 [Candidatus Marinimicrobia bacterium]|nr:hypothetical protein [bacterium]MCG2716502.1 hypothetical protein [Candidatus Neomarinimicrobiota bacterium]